MSNYKPITLKVFIKSVQADKYESAAGANRASGRVQSFNDADRKKAKAAVIAHYCGKPTPKKAGSGNRIKKATTKAFAKEEPYEVVFARVVMNGTKTTTLALLRGAAESGRTLPQLIQSIEAV